MSIKSTVSIIIRTLNEERYLPQLLKSIEEQRTDLHKEVVLIDSGSTDQTVEIAQRFGCKILYINRQEFSFGRSLNWACKAATGDYLVLVSGHCIPVDNVWLENLIRPLRANLVQYIYGRQLAGGHSCWSEHQILKKYFPSTSRIPQKGFFCNNANSALLKSVWLKYQFDEELTGLEDMYLAKRLVEDGGRIGYMANASVYHLHHETWPQVWRRFEREALALKSISPEMILHRRDIVRYFIRAVLTDISSLPRARLRLRELLNIVLYRYNQFNGSFCGNHLNRTLSSALKDSYFYPNSKKGAPLSSFHFK